MKLQIDFIAIMHVLSLHTKQIETLGNNPNIAAFEKEMKAFIDDMSLVERLSIHKLYFKRLLKHQRFFLSYVKLLFRL